MANDLPQHGDIKVYLRSIAHGQPRPYADSQDLYEISHESYVAYGPSVGWRARTMNQRDAMRMAAALLKSNGEWKAKSDETRHWADTYLDYFRPKDPQPLSSEAHVWEFRFVQPFTD